MYHWPLKMGKGKPTCNLLQVLNGTCSRANDDLELCKTVLHEQVCFCASNISRWVAVLAGSYTTYFQSSIQGTHYCLKYDTHSPLDILQNIYECMDHVTKNTLVQLTVIQYIYVYLYSRGTLDCNFVYFKAANFTC